MPLPTGRPIPTSATIWRPGDYIGNGRGVRRHPKERDMLWTIAVILLVLWALGFLAFHVAGGLIHLLLVIAVIVVVFQLITGRRAL